VGEWRCESVRENIQSHFKIGGKMKSLKIYLEVGETYYKKGDSDVTTVISEITQQHIEHQNFRAGKPAGLATDPLWYFILNYSPEPPKQKKSIELFRYFIKDHHGEYKWTQWTSLPFKDKHYVGEILLKTECKEEEYVDVCGI
jgi:hypothetical protein